ncbi:MAG: PH domain-containing protein [Saprospiraceae bacterium]|nr:PH domain-containing protein [Saprospiraceae bacterium]
MKFSNEQIKSLQLPSIDVIEYEKPDITYRKVLMYSILIFAFVLLVGYFVVGCFAEKLLTLPILLIVMLTWSILTGLAIIFTVKSYDNLGYALRDKDILSKSGVFFKSIVIVPFNRVQHSEIEQGPIERLFGLAELTLFTAGGDDETISGLSFDKAQMLKNYITAKVAADEEE